MNNNFGFILLVYGSIKRVFRGTIKPNTGDIWSQATKRILQSSETVIQIQCLKNNG